MQSNTSTTPSFASPEQQQEVLRNLDSAAFASPRTSNGDFVSNNPSGSYLSTYGNATFVSPQNSTPWNPYYQHDFHQMNLRRGSLPLKKRRVTMLHEDDVYPAPFRRIDESSFRSIDRHYEYTVAESHGNGAPMAVQQSSLGHYPLNPMNTTPFDKMNTLTLIAAAASANEAGQSPEYTCQPHTVSFTSSLSSFDRVDQMRNPNTSFVTTGRDGSSSDDSSESERTTSRSSDSAVNTSRVQPSRERHGRSSAVSSQKDFRASTGEASLQECPSSYNTSAGSGQDKRFTGLSPHQVRCHATTTRGRPCTYAAVQETKYCFLHADYEINPSPRRLKSSSDDDREMSSVSPAGMINTSDDVSEGEGPTSASPAPSFESNADTESKMSASTVAVFKKRRTNAKFAEKHAESSRPLLSMMATDQWFGQSVEIAVGPFESRTGIVQKWGNGWITVLIEGVGFHNRRSFELYLDTTNEDKKNEKSKHGKKKKGLSDGKKKEQDRNLFRCVSRDVVSPSPTATNFANAKSRASNGTGSVKKSRPVTPKLTPIVNSRNKKDGPNPKKLRVDAPSSLETPLPQRISDGTETPTPLKSSLEGLTKVRMTLSLPTPKVTPFSEKTTTATRTLTAQDRCNIDLEFPGHSDDEAKQSIGIKSSDSALVFRPSMGERTRGRAASLTGSHQSSQSSDCSV